MATLTQAHEQWANRPADETFYTLEAFNAAMGQMQARSVQADVRLASVRVVPDASGAPTLVGKAGVPARFSHWSFGQMARLAGAPADYLRKLPGKLAADCLNEGFARAEDATEPRSLLIRDNGDDGLRVDAVTSDKYARVWNREIGALAARVMDAPGSTWGAPEAFKQAGGSTAARAWGDRKALPIAFGGDRDCFVFLADYDKGIKVPGQDHPLARGFFLENSEVGAGSVVATAFLFDFACSNMLIWGATVIGEIRIPHRGNVRDVFFGRTGDRSAWKQLNAFAASSAAEDEARIRRARALILGDTDEDTISTVMGRRIPLLTQGNVSAAMDVARANPRYGDPRSVWGIVNGLTELSQKASHADARVGLDRAAGRLLKIAF